VDAEYGKGRKIAEAVEGLLEILAEAFGVEFKTPPHNIAVWVVYELKARRVKKV
jgi:hypothetical protein